MKSFSGVVLVIFVVLALFGVFVFATFTASRSDAIGEVVVWGSLSTDVMDKLLGHVRDTREDFNDVTYREVSEERLVPDLVEAIAAGRGPDLVLFPGSAMVKDGEKLASIPYSAVPRRDFLDSYIEAGEVFLRDDGVAALPVIVDPLVMYWNRTLFANAAVASPPRYWDDVAKVAPKLTQKSPNGSITVAAIALGGWDNVSYGKDILVSLMRQLGAEVVTQNDDGSYAVSLTEATEGGVQPVTSAVRYYVEFADPVKPVYSWNRSQRLSRDAFLAGSLAMYIAPASELILLREANPNLNFDVAPLPVARGAGSAVAARVVGAAVPRGARNPGGAASVAVIFASAREQEFLSTLLRLPSTRRDVEADASRDAFIAVFRSSALRAFSFLDPDPAASSEIFGRMIDNIASGRLTVSSAIRDAHDDLRVLTGVQ